MPRLRLLLAVLVLAGCGSGSGGADVDDASLLLDFTPNAVHSGIYMTVARDYDGAEGINLRIRRPSETTDAVRLLEAGRVDAAILDIQDLALARQGGSDLVGVMAVVQRPLAAIVARPDVRRPRDLEGRRVGVTGLPSDVAVLDSIVRGDGGDPQRVRRTTIGFSAVPALVAGRVSAATAFWNVEGLEVRDRVRGAREFRVDAFGAPTYPELVLCVSRATLDERADTVQRLVTALRRGYGETAQDPESAVETMLQRVEGLDRERLLAGLQAVSPAFTVAGSPYGALDPRRLEAWARWAQRFGLVDERPEVERAFAPGFTR